VDGDVAAQRSCATSSTASEMSPRSFSCQHRTLTHAMFATSSTRAGRTVSEGLTAQGMRRRQAPTPWPVRRRSHHRCARMRAQRTVRRQLGTERSRRWRPWSRSRGGAPAAAIRVPRVWRRSWNLTGRTPARSRPRPKRFRSLEASRDRASPRFREHQVVVGLPAGGLDMSVEFSGNSVGNGHGPGRARDFGVPHWPRV